MPVINITDETADELFQNSLISDYKLILKVINDLKNQKDTLAEYQLTDLENHQEYANAMEVLMGYYLTADQRKEMLK